MKLTTILLIAGCLQVSANGFTQGITLSEKDAPLQKVFKAIEQQTEYVFFVDYNWLQKAKKVTVEVRGVSLEKVLDMVF